MARKEISKVACHLHAIVPPSVDDACLGPCAGPACCQTGPLTNSVSSSLLLQPTCVVIFQHLSCPAGVVAIPLQVCIPLCYHLAPCVTPPPTFFGLCCCSTIAPLHEGSWILMGLHPGTHENTHHLRLSAIQALGRLNLVRPT